MKIKLNKTRAKVSSFKSDPSRESVSVHFYLRAILYASANFTATRYIYIAL